MHLNEVQVLLYALAVAFFLVNVLPRIKLTARKPFNCLQCMSGWCSLGLAVYSGYHWDWCVLFLMTGATLGAIVEGIIMRWL